MIYNLFNCESSTQENLANMFSNQKLFQYNCKIIMKYLVNN